MTKKIFRAICLVAVVVLLASLVLVMGMLYSYYTGVQHRQLQLQCDLMRQGVQTQGLAFFESLEITAVRVTWVDPEGTVLYDNQSQASYMENHAQREEIREALESGYGESTRYSSTLTERMFYYAERLSDGSVIRIATQEVSMLTLLLAMLQPICVVIAITLVLSMVLADRLAKGIVKPLNRLDLDHPLRSDAYEELSPLLQRIDSQQSQLKAQEKDLRRKQEEFATVTANMEEGLVLLSRTGKILSLNPAAARLLDTGSACVGCDILSVSSLPHLKSLLSTAQSGQRADTAAQINQRDYRLEVNPVFTDGKLRGIVLLVTDVTEQLRSEQLRREFTANVSHELKTPLQVISGYAELMHQGLVRSEDVPAFAGNIYHDTQRLIRLVEDIIRLSLLDEGGQGLTWQQVDLYAAVAEELNKLKPQAEKNALTLTLSGDPVSVYAPGQLIGSIVHNLCVNAVKYNVPGGSVAVELSDGDDYAALTVRDTGIGIAPEFQSRIFERFYRVDKSRSKEVGGTGLGLSIVKHAAAVLGAGIDLQSTPGKGTAITVRFPKTQK